MPGNNKSTNLTTFIKFEAISETNPSSLQLLSCQQLDNTAHWLVASSSKYCREDLNHWGIAHQSYAQQQALEPYPIVADCSFYET